jgi:UDP-N-acetylmuramoyl-tripeptide--D-alanyl-D-alanine ligase
MADILMSFEELSTAVGARSYTAGAFYEGFSSVHIDSRKVRRGGLFVALIGEIQDGHLYTDAAIKAGAAGVLAAEDRADVLGLSGIAGKAGAALLTVPNTLIGLQAAAAAYVRQFSSLLKIGITGSSGKTTTKEIAAAIIGKEKDIVVNPGNFNSETGLPLAVFKIRSHHETGVFELGMNRKGEISDLAKVLKPDIALITNIGTAHIGNIGSKEAIVEEKKAIFSEFTGTETALIPAGEVFRDTLAEGVKGRVVFYDAEQYTELGGLRDLGLEGTEITWEGVPARLGLPGKHNLKDAMAAIAIARELALSGRAIREGLESVKPLFGRSEIFRGRLTLIRDCYNANPDSMLEAIAFCDNLEWSGRRVYVIGSIRELGPVSAESHRRIGRLLTESRADQVFLFGEETRDTLEVLEKAAGSGKPGPAFFYTDTMDILARELKSCIQPGDLVLVKGSRSCALERLDWVFEDMVPEIDGNDHGKAGGTV